MKRRQKFLDGYEHLDNLLCQITTPYSCNKADHYFRPRRFWSAAANSRQTFPWTICRSVGPYVRRSVCPVHCGKMADRIRMPFGIIGRTGPGMRQAGLGFGDRSMGRVLLRRIRGAPLPKGAYRAYVCYSDATRPSSQITLGRLVRFCFQDLIICLDDEIKMRKK